MQVWRRKIIGVKFENLLKLVVARIWYCVLCFLWQWWWGLMFVFVIWNNNNEMIDLWFGAMQMRLSICNLEQWWWGFLFLWFETTMVRFCVFAMWSYLCVQFCVLIYGKNVCVWRFLERESWEKGRSVLGYGRIGCLMPSFKCWS